MWGAEDVPEIPEIFVKIGGDLCYRCGRATHGTTGLGEPFKQRPVTLRKYADGREAPSITRDNSFLPVSPAETQLYPVFSELSYFVFCTPLVHNLHTRTD